MPALGRRGVTAVAAAGCLLGTVLLAGITPAAGATDPLSNPPEIHLKTVKGHAQVVGTVTPLQPETILIRGMPSHSKFGLVMAPPFEQPQCQGGYGCNVVFPKRYPGTRRFRTSGKGRATAVFQMPDVYPRAPIVAPESIINAPFKNGDRITIAILSIKFHGPLNPTQGYAQTKATVEVPPQPAPAQ